MRDLNSIAERLELSGSDISTFIINGERVTNIFDRYTIEKGYKRDFDPSEKIKELKETVFTAIDMHPDYTHIESHDDAVCKFYEETYPLDGKNILFITVFDYDEFTEIDFTIFVFEGIDGEILKEKNGYHIGDVIFNPENEYDYKCVILGMDNEHAYGRTLDKNGRENEYDFWTGDFTEDGLDVYGDAYDILEN